MTTSKLVFTVLEKSDPYDGWSVIEKARLIGRFDCLWANGEMPQRIAVCGNYSRETVADVIDTNDFRIWKTSEKEIWWK